MPKPKKVIYVGEIAPVVVVKADMFHVQFDHMPEFAMRPNSFLAAVEVFRRAAQEWTIAQRAAVVPLRRRRRSHAAKS